MARKSRKNLELAPAPAKTIFNVGAYIRLSVVDRKQKGDSIETQQAIIHEFLTGSPDMQLREVYIDNGKTGQSFDRPAFNQMIADMENGRINCCIVKDLSRLGRNAIDAGYYIEKYFPLHGIRFISINDEYDSIDGNSGGILLSLKNMLNESYALEVGRKIRATHAMNIREGRFVGNLPPYGYLKSREDCHVLVPDENAAPIVRQMFEMIADGHSVKDIMNWLTDNEIPTATRYFHSIGLLGANRVTAHTHWSFQAVDRILRNRMYCGDMVQGKSKTVSHVSQKVPKSEWTVVESTHEPLVSRELFLKVQEIRDRTGGAKSSKFSTPITSDIFAGKFYCAQCGFTMSRRRHSETAYGYACRTQRIYAAGACRGATISEPTLKRLVFDLLMSQESKMAETLAIIPHEGQPNDSELAEVRAALDKDRYYYKSLYESLADGVLTEVEYTEMKAHYETKIATLTERENELRSANERCVKNAKVLSAAHSSVVKLEQPSDLTQELVGRLIERIEIASDKHITVKFTFNGGENNG